MKYRSMYNEIKNSDHVIKRLYSHNITMMLVRSLETKSHGNFLSIVLLHRTLRAKPMALVSLFRLTLLTRARRPPYQRFTRRNDERTGSA